MVDMPHKNDETGKEEEKRDVYQERQRLDCPGKVHLFRTARKECTHPRTMLGAALRRLSDSEKSTCPLLQRGCQ
jgi:hypothetical protein